jgi:hypothetical protein
MEQTEFYTIQFTYEIAEDQIRFPLQADVSAMSDNTYLINNIRLAGKANGAIIPPIMLTKQIGSWIYTDSKKETALSLAIGRAIDNRQ